MICENDFVIKQGVSRFDHVLLLIFLDAVLAFAQKASSAPNDLKMTMSDDLSDPHKIPSNVTPWHAEETGHH